MENYGKLPDHLEEPLGVFLYKYIDVCSNIIKDHVSPNEITCVNIILRIYIIYNLKHNIYDNILLLLIITCFLDFLDGYTARRYNKVTKVGDYLDHGSDTIFITYLTYIVYAKLKHKHKKLFILLIILLTFCSSVNYGCQQQYFSNEKSNFDISKIFCFDISMLNITKYFGGVVYFIYLGIICCNSDYFFVK